jgi:ribosomal protein S18 acetylase RimI-like enzyme
VVPVVRGASTRRAALHVRPATDADLPALVELGAELREALLPSSELPRWGGPGARSVLEQRFRDVLASDDRRLVLVVSESDEPLGMALLSVCVVNPLLDVPAVHMTHSVVRRRDARRGVGKALVQAAAAFADERGVDQLVVSVRPGWREANRFFARLGFMPLAVRRTASVSAVRRRIAQQETALTSGVQAGIQAGVHTVVRRRPSRGVGART